jgi:transcriptional regulator with XRE-family HTH domain
VATLKVPSLGDYIREQRESAQVSLRELARSAGVSNPYLSQIERGLRKPSAQILQQIAKGLRISAETLYVRAGLLEDRPGHDTSDVVAAVLADPTISDRHRRALIDIYQSFRAEQVAESTRPRRSARVAASRRSTSKPATTRSTKQATKQSLSKRSPRRTSS